MSAVLARVIDAYLSFEARDRAAWRAWLRRHYRTSPGVWLVYHKKASATPSVRYEEAVQEALCYGWIDSLVRTLDDRRYRQLFTPRRPGSTWSPSNKRRVALLVAGRRMTKAGLAKIEAAKADGSWQSLDAVETLTMPADLRRARAASPSSSTTPARTLRRGSSGRSSRRAPARYAAPASPCFSASRIASTCFLASPNSISVLFL